MRNSHQVWNCQKRSWSRGLEVWVMYMHKVDFLIPPRPSNTCHTISTVVIIPSGGPMLSLLPRVSGNTIFRPLRGWCWTDSEVQMSFRFNHDCLVFGSWEKGIIVFFLCPTHARFQLNNADKAQHTYQPAQYLRSKWRKSLESGLELARIEPYNHWSNSRKARNSLSYRIRIAWINLYPSLNRWMKFYPPLS